MINMTKTANERSTGKVEWFNPALGYGFLTTEDESKGQIFVHYTELNQEGYKKLRKDQVVTFIENPTEKGIQAKEVEVQEDTEIQETPEELEIEQTEDSDILED